MFDPPSPPQPNSDRLDSWKEIAAHLGRSVRGAQLWEREEGLPVHRLAHDKRATVYAYASELDKWWEARRTRLEPVSTTVSGTPQFSADPRTHWWKRSSARLVILAVAAILTIVVLTIGWFSRNGRPGPVADAMPLTSAPGLEMQPTFSPDGNYVAYSGGPGGLHAPDLFVKQIGSDSLRRITEHPAPEISPKWSPDGRQIAFLRILGENELAEAALVIIPALGGSERIVGKTWVRVLNTYLVEWLLDWLPDSETIVVADAGPTSEPYSLFAVNTRTGERWRLTNPPQAIDGDLDPAVSPDGSKLAFARGTPMTSELYLLDMDRKFRAVSEPHALSTGSRNRGPVWTPDGREILFASGPQHRKLLYRIALQPGSTAQPVHYATEGTQPLSVALSRRWQLAYPTHRADADIYRSEMSSTGADFKSTEFLKSTFLEHFPEYSPDGKRIAFVSNRTGSQQIWLADANGLNQRQLTSLPTTVEATWPRWAPDGTRIAFQGGSDTYVIHADGGPVSLWMKNTRSPEWSLNGEWMYFVSAQTGRAEIWKADSGLPQEKRMIQITRNGGATPRTSPDGRYLYFVKGNFPVEVWRTSINGGEEVLVIKKVANSGAFALSGAQIFFIPEHASTGLAPIMLSDGNGSSPATVAQIRGHPLWGITVSPDRRHVVSVHLRGDGDGDLMYVERIR